MQVITKIAYLKLSECSGFLLSEKQAVLRDAGFSTCLKEAKPKKRLKSPNVLRKKMEIKLSTECLMLTLLWLVSPLVTVQIQFIRIPDRTIVKPFFWV